MEKVLTSCLLTISLLADLASSLLAFDTQGLVPCLLQQVLPLIMNHAEADTILEDPKVQRLFQLQCNLHPYDVCFSFIDCCSWYSLIMHPSWFAYIRTWYRYCFILNLLFMLGLIVSCYLLSPGLGSCSVDGTCGVPGYDNWANTVKRRLDWRGNWTVRSGNKILFSIPWNNWTVFNWVDNWTITLVLDLVLLLFEIRWVVYLVSNCFWFDFTTLNWKPFY